MPKRSLSSSKTKSDSTKKKMIEHWRSGLTEAMKDPANVVESDDLITVIRDKYPKAEFHYLILPNEAIDTIKNVTIEHLHLLEHMEKTAEKISKEHKNKTFKIGYHAMPSMERLHLHIISDDMNSPALKTKNHWNSFHTEFFLESKEILKQLQVDGRIALPSPEECKNWLGLPLKCNKCDYKAKNMPDLKRHVLKH